MLVDESRGNTEPSIVVWSDIIDQIFPVALLNCDKLLDKMKREVDEVNVEMVKRGAHDEKRKVNALEVLPMLAHYDDQGRPLELMKDWQDSTIHKWFGDRFDKMHVCFEEWNDIFAGIGETTFIKNEKDIIEPLLFELFC